MSPVTSTPTTYYNNFSTTLKRSMTTASQTTGIVLNPIFDNNGVKITFTSIPLILTFIQGTKIELISAGGFTQDSSGNFTLTDVTRDLPRDGSSLTGQGNPNRFISNATVFCGIPAQILNNLPFLNSNNTFTGKQTFNGGTQPPIFADATARDAAFPSPWNGLKVIVGSTEQTYYNSTWNTSGTSSIVDGSTTSKGVFEEATVAEQGTATATGSSGARLVVANANLVKISSGAGDENKIAALNQNGQYEGSFTGMFPGIITPFAGTTAPLGWLLCYGQAVSRTTFAQLFTAIGTTYGTGDGSTTFNVPDLRGRFPLGKDNMGGTSANRVTAPEADNLGQASGAESHILTTNELPSHSHTITYLPNTAGAHSFNSSTYPLTGTMDNTAQSGGPSPTTADSSYSIGNTGSNAAHNNMSPYITLNYIIKS